MRSFRQGPLAIALVLAQPAAASATSCGPLAEANRLVLVTAATFNAVSARLHRYERDGPGAAWRRLGPSERAVVGRNGLAWGWPFRQAARNGEPLKREGDGRTPAGFYRLGRSFGSAASSRPDHLTLRPGRSFCIDDPTSPAYNTIVSAQRETTPRTGEDMGAEPLYRRGLVINYPSDASARAGSCIFLHVWRGAARGTAGCVALPEPRVAALQDFSRSGAVIVILPEDGLDRFSGCLPRQALGAFRD